MKPIVATLFLMSLFGKVEAAPCMNLTDSFSVASLEARAIFIGEVTKVEPLDSYENGELEIRRYRVTFKVEYSFKGAGFQEIGLPELVVISEQVIRAPQFLIECYRVPSFSEGKKYLVYAYESKDKKLVIGQWNASKPLWDASDDLKELKRKEAPFQFRVAHGPQ